MHKQRIEKLDYDRCWEEWDDMVSRSPAPRHRRRMAIRLLEAQAANARSILDVGCGNGCMLQELSQAFPEAKLHGCDVAAATIAQVSDAHPSIQFEVCDLSQPYVFSATHDIVTCMEVLEHVPDYRRALDSLLSALAPGAHLLITVPRGQIRPIDAKVGHVRHFTSAADFSHNDLELVAELHWGFPFFNLYKWAINLNPEGVHAQFASTRYGPRERAIADAIYLLFFCNVSWGGDQLICLFRRR